MSIFRCDVCKKTIDSDIDVEHLDVCPDKVVESLHANDSLIVGVTLQVHPKTTVRLREYDADKFNCRWVSLALDSSASLWIESPEICDTLVEKLTQAATFLRGDTPKADTLARALVARDQPATLGTRNYRGYVITHWRKPIPTAAHDFEFSHQDYDGPEDRRNGTGASVVDCKDQIDAIEFQEQES